MQSSKLAFALLALTLAEADLFALCAEKECTNEQCIGADGVCIDSCWSMMTEQRREELGVVLCKGTGQAEEPDLSALCTEKQCTNEQCIGADGVCIDLCWSSMTEKRREELGVVLCKGQPMNGREQAEAAVGQPTNGTINLALKIAGAAVGILIIGLTLGYIYKWRAVFQAQGTQGLPLKIGSPVDDGFTSFRDAV